MSLSNLDNLVKTGQLKKEPFNEAEFAGLVRSGLARLTDANNLDLAIESRFDLAYNAAHSLALAALRKMGYRSNNRFLVFQVLPHTTGASSYLWRILSTCHDIRNKAEYEGYIEISEQLLSNLLMAARELSTYIDKVKE